MIFNNALINNDKISHKILKISPEKIAKPLLITFSKSLQQSKYPSNWKIAHAIAIFKKDDTSLLRGGFRGEGGAPAARPP